MAGICCGGLFSMTSTVKRTTKRWQTFPGLVFPGLAVITAWVIAALFLAGCGTAYEGNRSEEAAYGGNPSPNSADSAVELSATGQEGAALFGMTCVACHGAGAVGTVLGPPLVHQLYEPGHHSDHSIRSAVQNGVPAHHWTFGDMPPVVGLSEAQVDKIICYIRELQLAEGIADRTPC